MNDAEASVRRVVSQMCAEEVALCGPEVLDDLIELALNGGALPSRPSGGRRMDVWPIMEQVFAVAGFAKTLYDIYCLHEKRTVTGDQLRKELEGRGVSDFSPEEAEEAQNLFASAPGERSPGEYDPDE